MTTKQRRPDRFHSVTPHLNVQGAARAIEFYRKAFGAEELFRLPTPDGKVLHAEIKIGDSIIMLGDEIPEMMPAPFVRGNLPVTIHLYVDDCDAVYRRATEAGATPMGPPTDMFWGDRYAVVRDPFGQNWSIATQIRDLTPQEIARAGQEAFSKPQANQAPGQLRASSSEL
ncbi:MAG TPA: VOC family protein [Planctomycetota bacterium]|nr:VOC family protein [Planctomycetota bacterium]